MNCPDCDNPVEKDAQFCPKCFARIEPPRFWQKLLRLLSFALPSPRSFVKIKKSVSIKMTDKHGVQRECHSMEEAPSELRAELEKLESEAGKEALISLTSDHPASGITARKTISIFRVKDA